MLNCLKIVLVCMAVVPFNPAADGLRITCSDLQSLKLYSNDIPLFNKFSNIGEIDPIVMGNVAGEELFLNNNIFEYLPGDLFDYNVNFTRVSFAENRITKIHPRTFRKLKELNSIYLNDNQLLEIDATLFRTNTKLEIINLDNNQIKFFHPNTFAGLTGLIFLYVQENQLRSFDLELLRPLRRLEGFFLRKNNLTEIDYPNLKEVTPLLSSLSLGDNYFNCSFAKQVDGYLLSNEIENKIYHDSAHANVSCVSDATSAEMARNSYQETATEKTTLPEEFTNEVLNTTDSLEPREGKCNIVIESMGKRLIDKIFQTFGSIDEMILQQKFQIDYIHEEISKHQLILDDLQKRARSHELKELDNQTEAKT